MALAVGEPVDLVHDERGFVVLVFGLVAGEQLTTDLIGPQVLRAPSRVVRDHRVGGIEDALRGAVVLLHHDHTRLGERLLEPHQVAKVSTAEPVDRLIGVSNDHDVAVLGGEHPHDLPLRHVRVLELVDEHVLKTVLPPGEHVGVLPEEAHDEEEQVVEVGRRRVVKTLLVLGVDLGDLAFERPDRAVERLGRAHELVLHGRDQALGPPGREALRVEVEVAPDVVGEADGVGLVVDRERRPVAETFDVAAQDPRARRVERRHPHAASDRTDEGFDAFLHLARGLVGERDREDLER